MLKTAAPTVSVCIPTYRGATHIGAAIESVLAQSYTDFELIVIDDNSPDDTAAIVQGYLDPRIRFLQNPGNLGPQGNWNRCLNEACGKYFKLLPQDDLLAPDCLAKQVAILDQDDAQRIALVYCARTIVDAQDRPLMVRGYSGGHTGIVNAQNLIRHCLRRGTNLIGEPGSVLFRRQLANSVGLFDASIPYVLDLDYWFRLLLKGDSYYLPEALASFRISRGSWSVAIGSKQSIDYRRFIEKIASDPDFSVRRIDILMGGIMAELNNYMRLVFYRFILN
jgi:glycosyltransferase involved in cell wall biosynthesis